MNSERRAADRRRADAVERWFVRRGIPHLIEDYSARTDILTRTVPFLALVFVGEVFVTFGDQHRGARQALVFVATVGLLLGATALVNRMRGRAPFALPDDVGISELLLFLLVPPIAALLFGDDRLVEAAVLFVVNIVVLGVAYLATSYGLVPMVRWGIGQVREQVQHLAALIVKTLPLLLLFSAFFLLNAEMWQVADELPGVYFVLVIGGMMAVGSAFVALATRTDIDELGSFASWDDVRALTIGTPVERRVPVIGVPEPVPLPRRARLNVALVMFVSQAVQILLVSLAVFGFYLAFGLLTVRDATLASWIGADGVTEADRLATIPFLSNEIVLTRQLLFVAGFVATFAGLQFAVQIVSDQGYRREFASGMAQQVRQALAVRAASAAG